MSTEHPTVRPAPATRSDAVHRPHHRRLTASSLGLALLVVGCAAPGAPPEEAPPAAVSVPARATTPTSLPATAATATSGAATDDAPAPEVWESRDLTPARSPRPAEPEPAPTVRSPDPVPVTTPAPTQVPSPEPEPSPTPAPPELVVGDDGCVTDRTTGLVVTCHDPAAGPDEDPALG
jgi:hypothetical protein